jgi:hypothetical protein
MVAGAGVNSDGFSTVTQWNATAWNQDPNTIAFDANNGFSSSSQGNTVMLNSLNNPFPGGVNPQLTSPPSGLGNNL